MDQVTWLRSFSEVIPPAPTTLGSLLEVSRGAVKPILENDVFSPLSLFIPLPFILLALKPSPPEVASWNAYLYLGTIGHFWVLLSLALQILPLLGIHNVVTAGSLFFPSLLFAVAILLGAKFLVYIPAWMLYGPAPYPWYRPYREVFSGALAVTAITCTMQALCWSRTRKEFKSEYREGGPACAVAFHSSSVQADAIWRVFYYLMVWTAVTVAKRSFARHRDFVKLLAERCEGQGMANEASAAHLDGRGTSTPIFERKHKSDKTDYDDVSGEGPSIVGDYEDLLPPDPTKVKQIAPKDTEVMVPWYSLLLVHTAFDIMIQLKVFLGRFDARMLQPAVHDTWGGKRKKHIGPSAEPTTATSSARLPPPIPSAAAAAASSEELAGCVFDFSAQRGTAAAKDSDELWFDWMADCGDGFNSSYQVSLNSCRRIRLYFAIDPARIITPPSCRSFPQRTSPLLRHSTVTEALLTGACSKPGGPRACRSEARCALNGPQVQRHPAPRRVPCHWG